MPATLTPLPIDRELPAILARLRQSPNLVIEAAPGSGKTTRVPPALLAFEGEVLVLEPRRLAARMAARRVAWELGEKLGETVGFQVRFEVIASPKTRLRFLTEGVFTRHLFSDPLLTGVSAIVLDEFHERHLDTDLALALTRRLQKSARPDLRIIVMSATLDSGPVARFLGDCPVVRSEGRLFPIEITHLPYSAAPLEQQVASALERWITAQPAGQRTRDVLVFLPGAAEIRKAQRQCESFAHRHRFLLVPLYGDLTPEEQDRAVMPASQPKIILSTNIAESSITIEGVSAVIDTGLARFAIDSPWTGLPGLELGRISKASAIQRAGRSGRTGPGYVLRLFTAEDFHRRPDHETPEIARRELSQLCMHLRSMGVTNPLDIEWLEAPPAPALQAAEALLNLLGTPLTAKLPLHPRLARLVTAGLERGAAEEACAVAALLSSGERNTAPNLLRALDEPPTPRGKQVLDQLRRIVRPSQKAAKRTTLTAEEALIQSVLLAFPDRVARRRAANQYLLTGNISAIAEQDLGEFIVAVDVEDRSERALPLIRLACPIEPDLLIGLFPRRVSERKCFEWNRTAERVEMVNALVYEDLVIDESREPASGQPEAASLLAAKVFEAGIARFVDETALDEFLARVQFAAQHSPVPALTEDDVRQALARLLAGSTSFAQVREQAAHLIPSLEQSIDGRALDEVAPSKLRLPGGRQTRIHYERGKAPWIASRLQDFFGMRESPRIARGAVPLVLHLLAPSQRPVQTTTDLQGFWERLYPQLRRELGRRYPKHAWPENPYVVENRI